MYILNLHTKGQQDKKKSRILITEALIVLQIEAKYVQNGVRTKITKHITSFADISHFSNISSFSC